MKTKLFLLSVFFLCSWLITACGSKPPTGENVEISVGTLNDNIVKYAIDIHTGIIDTSTIKIISGDSTGIKVPIDIEVDRGNKLFVLNQGNNFTAPKITIFTPGAEGNAKPETVINIAEGSLKPVGLTIAEGTDLMFVSYFSSNPVDTPRVIRFNATGDRKVFKIPVQSLGDIELFTPESVIYALDPLGKQILKLRFNSSFEIQQGFTSISGNNTGLQEPNSLALTIDGQIHVFDKTPGTDYGRILVYPANSSGDISPSRVLWNNCTGKILIAPYGLAVAEFLDVKVILACSGNKLTTLPAGSNGCAEFMQRIELGAPVSVAFDKVRF